jgi:hypothetical protein
MKILIGYSRCPHTRAAFEARGHDVWTCDLREADHPKHLTCDVWEVLPDKWDMAILHPMCTYLTVAAAWAFGDGPYHQKVKPGTLVGAARREARDEALENFRRLLALPYPKAIENPARSFVSTAIRPADQCVQPYEFGDDASKLTGLWLAGLPMLQLDPARRVPGRLVPRHRAMGKSDRENGNTGPDFLERWSNQTDSGQNNLGPSDDRWLARSDTYPGIAEGMARAWG